MRHLSERLITLLHATLPIFRQICIHMYSYVYVNLYISSNQSASCRPYECVRAYHCWHTHAWRLFDRIRSFWVQYKNAREIIVPIQMNIVMNKPNIYLNVCLNVYNIYAIYVHAYILRVQGKCTFVTNNIISVMVYCRRFIMEVAGVVARGRI